ncbi:MAG: histidine kinase N-terminal 7TM domain-containing protein, partial [Chloroflexota bacterium]
MSTFLVVMLIVASGSATWGAVISGRRTDAPGRLPFMWLMLGIAHWCLLSALHTITIDIDTRILWAKIQYFGIATVPLLWFLFALEYARRRVMPGYQLILLWIIPLTTIVMAWTNDWHGWLWSAITPASDEPGARLIYQYGPWFWFTVVFNYLLLLQGTILFLRTLYRRPLPLRRQSIAAVIGAIIPWGGNVLYLTGAIPIPGLDITPLAFATSGLLCAWGIFRYRLFDLVPIAREMVLEHIHDAVFVLDQRQRVMDANPATIQLIGQPMESLVGKTLNELIPGQPEILAAIRVNHKATTEVRFVQQEPHDFELHSTPIRDSNGRFHGQLIVLHDITAQKQVTAALEQAKQHAEHASAAKSTFLSTMTHELRTPLTTILGYCDLMRLNVDQPDPARLSHDIDQVQAAGDHLLTLISSILDFSKLEAGSMPLYLETFDIRTMIVDTHQVVQPLIERNANRLKVHSTSHLGTMHADLTKVRQILFNLLSNAAKFTQEGLIVFEAE